MNIDEEIARINRKLDTIQSRLNYIEEMSRGGQSVYIGDNKILFKAFVFGANIAFILNAKDRLFTPWFVVSGYYETALTNYIGPRLKRDSHCIDVGANFGYFTCLFARFCPEGKIIGIEPDPIVHQQLWENILINGFENRSQALNLACSNVAGQMTLYRREIRSGNTSMIHAPIEHTNFLGENPAVPFSIETATIDDISQKIGGRVDFIKIDVEGAEPLVLKGMGQTLQNNPNIEIIMEWSPAQIQAAGFNLGDFINDLTIMDLNAMRLSDDGEAFEIEWSELENAPYMAAIVLKKNSLSIL